MGMHVRTVLAAALLGAAPALCLSEGFSVSPVRLHLGERDRAVALRLGNQGQKELKLRAELYAWRQNEQGRDQLEPSDDLVMSPQLLRVPAQGEQVVRLILAGPRDPDRQMTYRLLLREERDVAPDATIGVPISLVLSLPIFVTPRVARHALECELQAQEGEQAAVRCRNPGRAHARIARLELNDEHTTVARFEGNLYLLPGAETRIPLAVEAGKTVGAARSLQALLDLGEWKRWPARTLNASRAE